MKKIILVLLMAVALFANETNNTVETLEQKVTTTTQEAPKTGFDAMSTGGKAAFIVVAPLIVAGAAITLAVDAVFSTPKWLIGKLSGE